MRKYVSDQEDFEKITQLYEENKQISDKKLFMFNVTMQNHGDYHYEGDNFEYTIALEGYSQEYKDAEQYLSLIHETDHAVEYLIHYFENVDNDVVVVFFGDHFPNLDESFYEEVHGGSFTAGADESLEYIIPFFVWANYDIKEKEIELTSINYLTNYMYLAAGLEPPAYNQLLEEVQQVVPAINSIGYYTKEYEKFHTREDAEEENQLLKLYGEFVYNSIFDKDAKNDYFFPVIEK